MKRMMGMMAVGVGMVMAGCASLSDRTVENAKVIRVETNVYAVVMTNVPCLIRANGSGEIPHFTDNQWYAISRIMTRATNSQWRLERKTVSIRMAVNEKP